MAERSKLSPSMRFGPFELSLEAGELRKHGQRLKLSGQAFQVLELLAENAGRLVTREELQRRLWQGASYGDFEHGLNAAVNRLRETLGDSATAPKYIETIPRQGYRFIAEIESEDLVSTPVSVSEVVSELKPPVKRFQKWSIVAGIVLILLAVATWVVWKYWPSPEPDLAVVPLTTFPGNTGWPSLSPDGQQVTFGSNWKSGFYGAELFVQSVGGSGPPLQLTHTAPPAFLFSWVSAWSPDGKWIAYERYNPKPGLRPVEIVLVPAPTGGPELILRRINLAQCGLSWSPDGKYLAFVDRDLSQQPTAIYLLQRDTLERRRITTPPTETLGGDAFPEFSRDGKRIAFIRNLNGVAEIEVITLASGRFRTLLSQHGDIGRLAWDPSDKDIIFGSAGLWRISSAGGKPRRLGIGEDGWAPSVSATAHRLTYQRGTSDSNIWRIRFGKDKVETRVSFVASSLQDFQPGFSPDETKIVLTSDRSGSSEIWITDSDGSNPMQLTRLETFNTGHPRWSPDGTQIAFDSGARGKPDIYLVRLDGSKPRRLTDDNFDDSVPSWSPDGRWIYYQSNRSGDVRIWKVYAEGGQPILVTQQSGEWPIASPDGKSVYFLAKNHAELWQKLLPEGGEHQVPNVSRISDLISYQVTEDGLYFAMPDADGSLQHSSLLFFNSKTRKMRTVAALGNMMFTEGISVSKDGLTILYSQQDHFEINIMLVENLH